MKRSAFVALSRQCTLLPPRDSITDGLGPRIAEAPNARDTSYSLLRKTPGRVSEDPFLPERAWDAGQISGDEGMSQHLNKPVLAP